jgi:3-isopropylmalate/(R)-2-methylmalate dehydratase large subunit
VVRKIEDGPDVFFIDHFIHEVISPVVFLGLKERGISVLYPSALLQLRITTHPQ